MLKLLICNNTLHHFAGSELFLYVLAKELKALGHEVDCFSEVVGPLAKRLQDDLDVYSFTPDTVPNKKYDCIVASHKRITKIAKEMFPKTKTIFTLHGLLAGPETPVEGCDEYVAVSEETQAIMKARYGIDAQIIRNPIDVERFKSASPASTKIRNILISSSYITPEHPLVKNLVQVAGEIGANLHAVGTHFGNGQHWMIDYLMNDCDVIFTLGRGVLEAMSCNRMVVSYGHWGIDGIVTKENYPELRKCNFSGRRYSHDWDVPKLLEELGKYTNKPNTRDLVVQNHDSRNIAKEYLCLIEK